MDHNEKESKINILIRKAEASCPATYGLVQDVLTSSFATGRGGN